MHNLEKFEQIINYKFKDLHCLHAALTHPSCNFRINYNYERLEFLGDSVLNLIITEKLIKFWPNETEGNLAKRRAYLISGEILSDLSKKIDLQKFIYMSDGEEHMGGRKNPHNLENAMEALIGAIYADGGLEEARKFIMSYWQGLIENMNVIPMQPKSKLQEWSQSKSLGIPEYILVNSDGPSHLPIFEIKVNIQDKFNAVACGHSKKEAENNAAKLLLDMIIKEKL